MNRKIYALLNKSNYQGTGIYVKLHYMYVIKAQIFRIEKLSNLITSVLKLKKTRSKLRVYSNIQ